MATVCPVIFFKFHLGAAFLGFGGDGVGGILDPFTCGDHGMGGVGDFVAQGVQLPERRGEQVVGGVMRPETVQFTANSGQPAAQGEAFFRRRRLLFFAFRGTGHWPVPSLHIDSQGIRRTSLTI